jgi:hypothetical protein
MFAYNPTVNNQAGSIMGAGMASAAATDAQAKGQMGNDILGALLMVSKAYTDNETQKAEGKAFMNTLGVMAPALGINEQQLAELKKSFKTPQEAAAYGRQVLAVAPSLINRNMAVMRPNNQIRVAGFEAGLRADQDSRTGKARVRIPMDNFGGVPDALPPPVEPSLPQPGP